MIDNEILCFGIKSGMIDLDIILQQYEMNKRKELLEKHPCRIWQGKNGYWYTYIPQNDNKRRLIKKKELSQLEEAIVDHYKDEPTVEEVFYRWIKEKKAYNEISDATCDRYIADYKRFIANFGMSKKRIKSVTNSDLLSHIKNQIIKHKLTSKAYGGFRTIIIGIWSYGYEHKLTDIEIRTFFNELRLPNRIFNHKVSMSEDNVFTEQEVELLTEYLLNNKPNVISYGILLSFRTGLRVGELCSLLKSDYKDNCLRICKTETRYRINDKEYIREVKDNAKTDAGNRYVLVDDVADSIIQEIFRQNESSEYMFAINGKRCIGQSFTRKLERACISVGIKPRSIHKCRKTYITTLINNQVPESLIIDQVGHTDIKTSRQYYLFNNKSKADARKLLSDALSNHE